MPVQQEEVLKLLGFYWMDIQGSICEDALVKLCVQWWRAGDRIVGLCHISLLKLIERTTFIKIRITKERPLL